jgi:YqjK-like protein
LGAHTRDELLRRREELLLRSGRLRQQWSQQVQALRAPLGVADRAREAAHWLMRHPEWPIGVLVVIVLLRPARALRWSAYAWQGWSAYQRVQRVVGGRRRPLI